jgi:nitrogen regulatory protein PII
MTRQTRKLLTIITEAAIESQIIQDIERLGVTGYTVSDARGKGHRGARSCGWDAGCNIRVDIVCDEETVDAIAADMRKRHYDNYAMIAWVTDVGVLRSEEP